MELTYNPEIKSKSRLKYSNTFFYVYLTNFIKIKYTFRLTVLLFFVFGFFVVVVAQRYILLLLLMLLVVFWLLWLLMLLMLTRSCKAKMRKVFHHPVAHVILIALIVLDIVLLLVVLLVDIDVIEGTEYRRLFNALQTTVKSSALYFEQLDFKKKTSLQRHFVLVFRQSFIFVVMESNMNYFTSIKRYIIYRF